MEIDGNPWFVAADVLRCLGFSTERGTYQRLKPLSSDEKRTVPPKSFGGKGSASLTAISESGLYKLTLRAQRSNPEAARFQDWITREVLPAIRKDGAYVMGEEKVRTGELSEDGRHRGAPGTPIPHSIGYIRSSTNRRPALGLRPPPEPIPHSIGYIRSSHHHRHQQRQAHDWQTITDRSDCPDYRPSSSGNFLLPTDPRQHPDSLPRGPFHDLSGTRGDDRQAARSRPAGH